MTDADKAALELAIEMVKHSGESVWVQAVAHLLETRGFAEAGQYAAHCMQFRSLRSRPWLMLPSDLSDADVDATLAAGESNSDHCGRYAAAMLAKRMRDHGVSKWHPNPMRALAEAARKSVARERSGPAQEDTRPPQMR